jgi:hypothetical protein
VLCITLFQAMAALIALGFLRQPAGGQSAAS